MTAAARPLFRRDPAARLAIASGYVGRWVTVVDDLHRDGTALIPVTGQLLAVAIAPNGGCADVAVVKAPGDVYARALSLARVRSIELAP